MKLKKKGGKGKFRRAIIVLIRNTTWRCGKLERLIINHLHKKTVGFGKSETSLDEMLQNFRVTGKKKNEFLDAVKRLERRNIIRILNL